MLGAAAYGTSTSVNTLISSGLISIVANSVASAAFDYLISHGASYAGQGLGNEYTVCPSWLM